MWWFAGHSNNHAGESEDKLWVREIIDVEAAFLEGDMDEQIYIEWANGVLEFGFETQEPMKNK